MIKLLRLVTGEDVVADVPERKPDAPYVLKKPHRLVLAREGLGSMPLCPFAKSDTYEVRASHVLWEAEPEDEIRDSYASATGSIVVASSGIISP
jgi:hypothetical protein